MRDNSSRYYEFGSFCLDVKERELRKEGVVVLLTPKAFDMLLILVERCGTLVEKEEMMRLLWPESFVEDSSLSQHISVLRKALGETSKEWHFIETVPKRGYRFIGTVKEKRVEPTGTGVLVSHEADSGEQEHQVSKNGSLKYNGRLNRRFVLIASVVLLTLLPVAIFLFAWRTRSNRGDNQAPPKLVAVVPFKTLGQDEDSRFLSLGLADALIIRLGKLDGPSILPTSAVFKYVGQDRDARSIGEELGADAVLEGTVQRTGKRVRVTAQMIRIKDGKSLWAGTYEEQSDNIFFLQDSLSEQIVSSLNPQIDSQASKKLARRSTNNKEAYQAYLMGLFFWSKRSKEGILKAIDYCRQAIELDPEFAQAFSLLADCYYVDRSFRYNIHPPQESLQLADEFSRRAVELGPNIAESYVTAGGVSDAKGDLQAAEADYKRALALAPNLALAHLRYGNLLFEQMNLEQAIGEMKRAQELEPMSFLTNATLSRMLYLSRDYDTALKYARRSYELKPDEPLVLLGLGDIYLQKGMYDKAIDIFKALASLNDVQSKIQLTRLYATSGRREQALAIRAGLLRSTDKRSIPTYALVSIYSALGDNDLAFDVLNHADLTYSDFAMLRYDPQFDPVRMDQRYKQVMSRSFFK
jgi:TolB-like protein/DNA-binding winged helix-turn-helix (wHTH) protein/Tfp pilus assembly protein PilF